MITIDKSIPGWAPEAVLEKIGLLTSQIPDGGTIVEIGVYWGRVTNAIVSNKLPNTKVICIDPCDSAEWMWKNPLNRVNGLQYDNNEWFEKYFLTFNGKHLLDNIISQSTSLSNVRCIQDISDNVEINFSVDMAIIDGNHDGDAPLKDMLKFIEQQQCLIIMDDYNIPKFHGVTQAVNIAKEKYNRQVKIFANHWAFILPNNNLNINI